MNNTSLIADDWHELQPAYGRDYSSAAQVREAFLAGQDFEGDYTLCFKPCSVRDFAKGTKQLLRYRKLQAVAQVVVP